MKLGRAGCLFLDSTETEARDALRVADQRVRAELNEMFLDAQTTVDPRDENWIELLGAKIARVKERISDLCRKSGSGSDIDAFLSYHRNDSEKATEVFDVLSCAQLAVFFDRDEISPGDRWRNYIRNALQTTRCGIVLVGPEGFGPTQKLEVDGLLFEKRIRDVPIFPIQVDGSSCQLPEQLKDLDSIDLAKFDRPFDRLVEAVRNAVAKARLENLK